MSSHRRVLVLLVLTVLVLFHPFLLRGEVFVGADFLNFIYPWKAVCSEPVHNLELLDVAVFFYPNDVFINQTLKSGEFPLWNPHLFSGHPILASGQSALFYPPKLLAHWLFSPAVARTWILFLHTLAALILGYLWLRGRDLSPAAAGVGAMVLALNTQVMSWMEFEHMVVVFTYLPLMLLCIDRALADGRLRWWGLLAVAGALSLHGAHLQYNLYAGMLVGWYAVIRLYCTRRSGGWKKALPALLVTAVATLALAAPTLLPVLELNRFGQRLLMDWSSVRDQTSSLTGLVTTLLNPDALGNPARGFMLNRCKANLLFPEFASYIGFLPLLLGLYGLRRKGGKNAVPPGTDPDPIPPAERNLWALTAGVSLLFAAATPFYWPVYRFVPLMDKLVPTRFLLLFVVAGAILAALGTERYLRDPEPRGLTLVASFIAGLWTVLLVGAAYFLLVRSADTMAWLAAAGYLHPSVIKIPPVDPGAEYRDLLLARLRNNYLLNPQMYLPLVSALGLWLGARRPRWRAALILGITACDLLLFAAVFNTHMPRDQVYPPTPGIEYLQSREGLFRVQNRNAAFYNTLEPYGLYLATGYESLFPRRYLETLRRVEPDKRVNMRTLSLRNLDSPILDSLNVEYALLPPMDALEGPRWELVFDGEVRVYRNSRALPRAYVAGKVRTFGNFEQAATFMETDAFNPSQEVVMEHPLPGPVSPEAADSTVRIDSYRPTRVSLQVAMRGPGLLVLADHHYPGWRCRVDGRAVPIYPVNGVSRGVYLGPEGHEVVFEFRPQPLQTGLGWCFTAAVLLSVLVGLDEWRRRPSRAE